ncbi:DUF2637 domain-containing protein [Streptomyces sp. NPDC087532]|uniref:DUF2637 domain-containing protein n=1 Tax=Streptomyces sp. NPDC087532 TaxID=3365795 RepID=UPI003809D601
MHQQIAPTPLQRLLIAVVIVGVLLVAGIAFVGSYTAVRDLAASKGFGTFSVIFPIGIDCGILVVLSLDVLLTWLRCPFPLLRHTAWLLTGATIAFNAAVLWPDLLGTAMHAALPVIFTVTVEAARHAVGRLADITDARHIEDVRLARWFLSPVPTFKLWRGMQLWNRRSYQTALQEEQDRLLYIAKLKQRHGVWWRYKAMAEELLPLRLAALGVPLPPSSTTLKPKSVPRPAPELPHHPQQPSRVPAMAQPGHRGTMRLPDAEVARPATDIAPTEPTPTSAPLTDQAEQPSAKGETLFGTKIEETAAPGPLILEVEDAIPILPVPEPELVPEPEVVPGPDVPRNVSVIAGTGANRAEAIYAAFAGLTDRAGKYPSMPQLSKFLFEEHSITGQKGRPMSAESLRRYRKDWVGRYERETQGVRAALPG